MTKRRLTVLTGATAMAGALTAAGCSSTTFIDEQRKSVTGGLEDGESVVILRKNQRAASKTDYDFVECVSKSLASDDFGVQVVPEQTFVDALYPYFETSSAPMQAQALGALQQEPAVVEKLADLGARYIVWMRGNTETVDRSGSFTCSIGPGGGGCFGLASWTDQGTYKADVWDIKNVADAGTIDVESSGTSHLAGLIVPIPMLASVESDACEAMATEIVNFVQPDAPTVRQAESAGG